MNKSYQPWTQDQTYLLPPSLRDWLPEEHLAWFILEVVEELDLSLIEAEIQRKDARGQRPYHPQMMVALLLYSYCTGVYSSRKIERATYEDIAFRVLSGNSQPYFTTINEFRRVHREQFAELFVQALKLCRGAGLVKLGHVAIDGTKVKASASKHKAMSYKRLVAEEKKLKREVQGLLNKAQAADRLDDERYGEGERGEELPEELKRRESRLARVKQAKAQLEAEAREGRAAALREHAEGMEDTANSHDDEVMRRRLRTSSVKRRRKADELDPPGDDEPPEGPGAEELAMKSTPATTEGLPRDDAQRNFTDAESSIMMGRDGFIQAYNAQLAVDEAHQVIVGAGVTNQPADNAHLTPMLNRVKANLGAVPEYTTGDSGYWHPEVESEASELGTRALVATGRVRHGESGSASTEGEPPEGLEPRERMRWRLNTVEGRGVYSRRKCVVEPVNGQIKHARGFCQFSFRGRSAVEAEWQLVGLCHNLLKLFNYRENVALSPG